MNFSLLALSINSDKGFETQPKCGPQKVTSMTSLDSYKTTENLVTATALFFNN